MAAFLITLILVLSSAVVHAFEITTTITLEKYGGYYGVAYDSSKGEIFLTNGDFDLVYAISGSTYDVVATIPVGRTPAGIAYDSAKGELFVANYGSDSVSVISDKNYTVVATIPVGHQPMGIVYDSGKGEIFVTNYNSSSVSVISDSSNTVMATIPVGSQPCGLAYDSVNGQIFVANFNSRSVSVISDRTNTVVATVALEGQPQAIGYDSGKREIFVTYSESNRVSVISDSSIPSFPEHLLFIVVSLSMITIFLAAILYTIKNQNKTRATNSLPSRRIYQNPLFWWWKGPSIRALIFDFWRVICLQFS